MTHKKNIYSHILKRTTNVAAMAVFMFVFFATASSKTAYSEENFVDLADYPLEVMMGNVGPPLINLVLDNTRPMYWTIMTSEGDGTFTTSDGRDYQLVFPEDTFAGASVLPYGDRNYWRTQWSGYNTMYYNPSVDYEPWPHWETMADNWSGGENADPDNPRWHPMDTDTLDLNETFYTLGQEGSGYTLTFRDIEFTGNEDNWEHVNPGEKGYVSEDDHFYFTETTGETTTWTFDGLTENNRYDVYIFVPYYDTLSDEIDEQYTDGIAQYTVTNANQFETRTLEKQDAYDGWTQIATNIRPHNQNDNVTIELENISGAVAAGSARIVYAGEDIAEGDSSAVSMIFAHYYVKGDDDEIYLVNLDQEIEYYHFSGPISKDRVEEGELTRLDPDLDQAQIDAAGIRTGREYEQERQNFANWYQFYRKRSFTGIGAVSRFLKEMRGAYFRMTGFPPAAFDFPMAPIDVTVAGNYYDETLTVLKNLYNLKSPQAESNMALGTALDRAGRFFDYGQSSNKEIEYSHHKDSPFFDEEYGGECQQAFAILMTGGFWRVRSNADTLAETAEYYWSGGSNEDLAPLLPNKVPTNPLDEAYWHHLVTYGISFGVTGENDPDNYPDCNLPGGFDCPVWPEPQSFHKTTIDDLWHATVKGRGLFINAADPEELTRALLDILHDIEMRVGTAAAVSVSNVQREVGTKLYKAQFNSERWSGDLLAFDLEELIGDSESDPVWSASDKLDAKDEDDRVIFTFDGLNGIPFRYDNLNSSNLLYNLNEPQVQYLRGDRSREFPFPEEEEFPEGKFRPRDSKMGDIIHSIPTHHNDVVYVGANAGMLHAFDAQSGEELFAYAPGIVLENLYKLTDPGYEYQYYVDGTPFIRTVDGESILVGGLRGGGKGYYALDVTNPHSIEESDAAEIVKWEFTDHNDLGYSFSMPVIMRTEAEGWVVLFGNGYNSQSGNAVLFIRDVHDGSEIVTMDTEAGPGNGIVGNIEAIDTQANGYIDFVYAGDLKGNIWKFDLRGSESRDWKISYNGEPLFTAESEDGKAQPITTAPDIIRHCVYPGYMVIFGTGKFVSELDFDDTSTQSLYGIWDWQEAWETLENDATAGDDKHFGTFNKDFPGTLSNMTGDLYGLTLLRQGETDIPVTVDGVQYRFISDNEINWYDPGTGEGDHVGWVFDLIDAGERVIHDPWVQAGHVRAVGTIPAQDPCEFGGRSNFYALNACTGGRPSRAQYFDDDGTPIPGDPGIRQSETSDIATRLPPGKIALVDPDGNIVFIDADHVRSGTSFWHEW